MSLSESVCLRRLLRPCTHQPQLCWRDSLYLSSNTTTCLKLETTPTSSLQSTYFYLCLGATKSSWSADTRKRCSVLATWHMINMSYLRRLQAGCWRHVFRPQCSWGRKCDDSRCLVSCWRNVSVSAKPGSHRRSRDLQSTHTNTHTHDEAQLKWPLSTKHQTTPSFVLNVYLVSNSI